MKRQLPAIALLVLALVGVSSFIPAGCGSLRVFDPATGTWRPYTPADANATLQGVGAAAGSVAVASGNPEWLPVIDAIVRIAALLSAWAFQNPWQAKTQTDLAVAAAVADAKNGTKPGDT